MLIAVESCGGRCWELLGRLLKLNSIEGNFFLMLLGELLLRLWMNLDSWLFGVAIHVLSDEGAEYSHYIVAA